MTYRIPADTVRGEHVVRNSRFIYTAGHADSVDETKAFLSAIRSEMPDASHHVYAFRVGFGNSVIEGVSDDGEPSGTSGPPILSIVRGSNVGDVIIVVTRYFGGTKLGTGGLVRAYGDAARAALDALPTEVKIAKTHLAVDVPYALYETCRRLIEGYEGEIQGEDFGVTVTIDFSLPLAQKDDLGVSLRDATSGQIDLIILE